MKIGAFCCGALAVAGAGILTASVLTFSNKGFWASAQIQLLAHLPIMVIEGIVTMFAVSFIARIRPEILQFSK